MDEKKTEDDSPASETERLVQAVTDEDAPVASEEKGGATVAAKGESAPVSTTLQGLTDKALHFLSHASNETLGACVAGLGAATYLVLGRVGLLIIGVAGGVVLHATWEGVRSGTRDEETKRTERERRREAGIDVVKRVLELRASKNLDEPTEDTKVYARQQLDYTNFEPETAKALNTFTDAVIKDYVYYWYGPQLPGEESFPDSCRRTFTAFVLSLSGHLNRKRPADAFLDFVTHASSILIVFLNELSVAVNASPNSAPADAIKTYLELKPDSSLAYVLDENSQNKKLGLIAEDILQAYLDPKAYNCEPVHVFLKEVLANLVLGSTITLCSRPEWINEWIVYGLEESATTKEVMDIVDAGVEGRSRDKGLQSSKPVTEQPAISEIIEYKNEGSRSTRPVEQHKRQVSKAEEAMDEAMKEAKRLTQLMMEEDERRAREQQEKQQTVGSSEDVSDVTTQGAPTPTSSQSDRDRQEDNETASWTTRSNAPSIAESPTSAQEQPVTPSAKLQFTSFDQLVPDLQPTALSDNPEKSSRPPPAPLTLHNARMSIFDDSVPGEKTSIKAKPTIDYLIQIEPALSAYSGWMIARTYSDFETLHEVLRRISVITGVVKFAETHAELPKWRAHTKASLRTGLERYLTDAVRYQPLAESEGMKRFLEKERGLSKSPNNKAGFGWPTPDAFGKLGGDMMNVLTKAPKQVAGGGKVIVGGVTGGGKAVFDGVAGLVGGVAGTGGSKRQSQTPILSRSSTSMTSEGHKSKPSLATDGQTRTVSTARQSQDSSQPTASPSERPTFDRHISTGSTTSVDWKTRSDPALQRPSLEAARDEPGFTSSPTSSSKAPSIHSPSREAVDKAIHLPPPPSEMPEDYGSPSKHTTAARSSGETFRSTNTLDQRMSESVEFEQNTPPPMPPRPKPTQARREAKPKEPLSEGETSVAVELMFAVVTELYTLSSAWNIRRTLLTAAKTYLLRPGNQQLITIRDLLQTSLLDANLSDPGLASQIYKMRENALPTEEEMEIWRRDYPEKNEEQKDELRVKARRLLVQNGMPAALQGIMGAAASGEALGKVFDCLQVESVSRGLVFGLMLQALRVITH